MRLRTSSRLGWCALGESVGSGEVAALGAKRVLLVYGGGSVVRTGLLARVTASLEAAGVEHVELPGVRPNPEVGLVRTGIELAREKSVD